MRMRAKVIVDGEASSVMAMLQQIQRMVAGASELPVSVPDGKAIVDAVWVKKVEAFPHNADGGQ